MLKVKAELGPAVFRNMSFLYAILGCDMTSRPYGIGKAVSLKKNMLNLSTSKIKRRYSTPRDQHKPRLRQRERMPQWCCMEENQARASIASATVGTTKKWQLEVNRYSPTTSPNIRSSQIPQPCGLSTGQTLAVSW